MATGNSKKKPTNDKEPKAWRNVGLMPLSGEQMREFALLQGVADADALLADIRRRDAEEFAEKVFEPSRGLHRVCLRSVFRKRNQVKKMRWPKYARHSRCFHPKLGKWPSGTKMPF